MVPPPRSEVSCELGLIETTQHRESIGVAPLMARQPPVVVVPGGERQVDRHRHGPSAYGGGRPLPLGRRRFQYIFFETAKKRKSRSEFRCGFLFEEPGGLNGGSPVSS